MLIHSHLGCVGSLVHGRGRSRDLQYVSGNLQYGVSNPLPSDPVNPNPNVIKYKRSVHHLYDVVLYSTSKNDPIRNPSEYSTGTRYFTLDVYAPIAPSGTVLLLQLENSARANATYPVGRHSRYIATINRDDDAASGWQQLRFVFVDCPDSAEAVADQVTLLFAPGTYTAHTFYFDNFMSYRVS
jgi:hypothetical protein